MNADHAIRKVKIPSHETYRTNALPVLSPVPGISIALDGIVINSPDVSILNVVDRNGVPITDGALYRLGRECFSPIDLPLTQIPKMRKLSGIWLYGGDYWSHFGHFLFESLSQVWAMDYLDVVLDGMLYSWPRHDCAALLQKGRSPR